MCAEQQGEADGPVYKACKTKQDEEDNLGQRVIPVAEPHTDINAGLVIILDSDHESPLDLADAAKVADQFPPGWPCCRSVAFSSSRIGSSSCWARIVALLSNSHMLSSRK